MKIQYIDKRFNHASRNIINSANEIIEEYQARGYDLTLRQLYYQFVSRDLITNNQSEYKRLGSVINDARLAGLIDWYAITDRTRNMRGNSHWTHPSEILRAAASSFYMDRWENQDRKFQVWIEKDALVGVIANVCKDLDVTYFSCRGYVSQSEMWLAGRYIKRFPETTILHLGDHDPSGIDMSRDIQERLTTFAETDVEVIRLALNMDQIQEYAPPPNPAKITDSRYESYIQKYGYESWELDALDPDVLSTLIRDAIEPYIDEEALKELLQQENAYKNQIQTIIDEWSDDEVTRNN